MEDDWENERTAFIAGEVGEAAIWLILKGEEVSRAAMAELTCSPLISTPRC